MYPNSVCKIEFKKHLTNLNTKFSLIVEDEKKTILKIQFDQRFGFIIEELDTNKTSYLNQNIFNQDIWANLFITYYNNTTYVSSVGLTFNDIIYHHKNTHPIRHMTVSLLSLSITGVSNLSIDRLTHNMHS